MADGKSRKQKRLRAVLKAAIWGGVIAAIVETVLVRAVVDDWGYAIGHPRMTDVFSIIALILSLPALFLERICGFLRDPEGGTEIYLTAFLSIIFCAITFAIVASVWQFAFRRRSGISN